VDKGDGREKSEKQGGEGKDGGRQGRAQKGRE